MSQEQMQPVLFIHEERMNLSAVYAASASSSTPPPSVAVIIRVDVP